MAVPYDPTGEGAQPGAAAPVRPPGRRAAEGAVNHYLRTILRTMAAAAGLREGDLVCGSSCGTADSRSPRREGGAQLQPFGLKGFPAALLPVKGQEVLRVGGHVSPMLTDNRSPC